MYGLAQRIAKKVWDEKLNIPVLKQEEVLGSYLMNDSDEEWMSEEMNDKLVATQSTGSPLKSVTFDLSLVDTGLTFGTKRSNKRRARKELKVNLYMEAEEKIKNWRK